jgi:hypothetical protein
MTLPETRDECASLLPGVVIQRHALLRYLLLWTKPIDFVSLEK